MSLLICSLVIVFFAVVATGPGGRDWLNRRKRLKEQPLAKVLPFPYPPKHPRKL